MPYQRCCVYPFAYSDMTVMVGMSRFPCYLSCVDMSTYVGCIMRLIIGLSVLLLDLLSSREAGALCSTSSESHVDAVWHA